MPLNPWVLLGLLVSLLAAFGSGFAVSKHYADTECVAGQVQAQRTEVVQAATEATRRETVGAARETSREQIRVVYRTIKEQADAIEHDSSNTDATGCGLDADGLRIWNAANSGVPATLSGEPDGRLPGAAASAVGEIEGFAGQPHRGDGAVRPMSGSVEQAGSVRESADTTVGIGSQSHD